MKPILYIHALIEVIGGVIFYIAPQYIIYNQIEQSTLFMTKIYGILAVIFGLVSMEVARSFQYTGFFKRVFLIIMGFHVLIGFCCFGFYRAGAISIGAMATHLVVCVGMMIMYFRDLPQFTDA